MSNGLELPNPSHKYLNERYLNKTKGAEQERIVEGIYVLSTQGYNVWEVSKMSADLFGVKGLAACYVFKDKNGEILYVGESDDLRRRIVNQHLMGLNHERNGYLYKFFYSVEFYIIDMTSGKYSQHNGIHGEEMGYGYRKALEQILIKKLNPVYNGKHRKKEEYRAYMAQNFSLRRRAWSKNEKNLMRNAFGGFRTFKL